MNIILIGYRGCGKTTLGKQVAQRQWLNFVDVDDETRKRFKGALVADIWAEHGEAEWRRAEVEVTQELCARDGLVIALGGGTLMEPQARRIVLEAQDAVRIYLHCEPQELHRRITQDASSTQGRPPLTDLGGGLEEIERVLAKREPVYRAVADKVFDVTHLRPDNSVRYLIERCL
jgi:shikimate kinase